MTESNDFVDKRFALSERGWRIVSSCRPDYMMLTQDPVSGNANESLRPQPSSSRSRCLRRSHPPVHPGLRGRPEPDRRRSRRNPPRPGAGSWHWNGGPCRSDARARMRGRRGSHRRGSGDAGPGAHPAAAFRVPCAFSRMFIRSTAFRVRCRGRLPGPAPYSGDTTQARPVQAYFPGAPPRRGVRYRRCDDDGRSGGT